MPELPEVETVRRTLAERIVGDVIAGVDIRFSGCVENPNPEAFRERVTGRTIREVGRRAKYLLLHLDDASAIVIHLRMTGRLTTAERPAGDDDKHLRLSFALASGLRLCFHDQRKFGRVGWYPDERELAARIRVGPDPTASGFDAARLSTILAGRRRPVKALLLDQALIGGLGNIYADESLFRASIAPQRRADSLCDKEVEALCRAIREVLDEGLRYRGTSLRDYVDGDGRKGGFQERLRVYGREGKPCVRCESLIARAKIAGRSSFYCPNCQREGAFGCS